MDWISLDTLQTLAHQYGYWVVCLGILFENLGLPLPGEAIVLVGGFLAGEGDLNYWAVLGCAIAGSTIGGTCGYWVGYYGGWPLLSKVGKWFNISEERLLTLKESFSTKAARTVLLGRFIALLRIFASPLAGIAGMPFRSFFLFNTLGAVLWAVVMVTLAFFAGEIIPLARLITSVSQFGLLVLVAIMGWLFWPRLHALLRKGSLQEAGESESP
ncbi:MAG: DedA family protein [Acaryochloris sp. RU_4_1]|nr:DedA family protein [Acaryochloris sp. RU_4_1]NJN38544.1 DedA family protein [Acaryochloridaceae cyanobacterium CSU_3_4]NJR55280.1 DedA family protein [Acaryochloris sp. CRU_2_0]